MKQLPFFLLLLIFLTFSIFDEALSQHSGIASGNVVRISAPMISPDQITGTVIQISSTEFLINSGFSDLSVPISSITGLSVNRGQKRNTGKGALIGIGIGGLTGGFIGAATYSECTETGIMACAFEPKSRAGAFGLGALFGSVVGGLAGVIIGSLSYSDRWQNIPLTPTLRFAQKHTYDMGYVPEVMVRIQLK